MSEYQPVLADETGARALSALIAGYSESVEAGTAPQYRSVASPVIVAEPTEFPSEDPEGTVKARNLRLLNGATWDDTKQPVNVRKITNGRQIAWPVGRHGLCVQDQAFWAVNIGSLAAATNPLTGHTTGNAAVLESDSSGNLTIKSARLEFVRRDASGTIDDGTLIQLAYVSGTLTIVWADCTSHADLEGLSP